MAKDRHRNCKTLNNILSHPLKHSASVKNVTFMGDWRCWYKTYMEKYTPDVTFISDTLCDALVAHISADNLHFNTLFS